MHRRTYLALSGVTLSAFAGCAGDDNGDSNGNSDGESGSDNDDGDSGTPTEEPEEEEEMTPPEENGSEGGSDQLEIPELYSVEAVPQRRGPDEKIPRGVDLTLTLSGGAPLRNGQNELRSMIEVLPATGDREETIEQMFTVQGDGNWTEFEEDLTISSSPFPGDEYGVFVEVIDDEFDDLDARSTDVDDVITIADYNVRELDNAYDLFESLDARRKEMVEMYVEYGGGNSLDSVPILTSEYNASELRAKLREASSILNDLDINAPDAFDDRFEYEEARFNLLWTLTFYHHNFREFGNGVISDLDLLRELEFEQFHDSLEEYPDKVDDLENRQEKLDNYASDVNQSDADIEYTARVETLKADLEVAKDIHTPLEYLHSATENIVLGLATDEDSRSLRRERRLNAKSRISSARIELDSVEPDSLGELLSEIHELADDLESVADEI